MASALGGLLIMGRPCGCCGCEWNLARLDPATGTILKRYLIRPDGVPSSGYVWHGTDLVALQGSAGLGMRFWQSPTGGRYCASVDLTGSPNWITELPAIGDLSSFDYYDCHSYPNLASLSDGALVWTEESYQGPGCDKVEKLDNTGATVATLAPGFDSAQFPILSNGDRLFVLANFPSSAGVLSTDLWELDASLGIVHHNHSSWRRLCGLDPTTTDLLLQSSLGPLSPWVVGSYRLPDGWTGTELPGDAGQVWNSVSWRVALGYGGNAYFWQPGLNLIGQRDLATLTTQWTVPVVGSVIRIAAGNDRIFFGGNDLTVDGAACHLCATDASGTVLWTLELPGRDTLLVSGVVGVFGLVYLPDSDQLWLCANEHSCH